MLLDDFSYQAEERLSSVLAEKIQNLRGAQHCVDGRQFAEGLQLRTPVGNRVNGA
jgi:hypothetical protein